MLHLALAFALTAAPAQEKPATAAPSAETTAKKTPGLDVKKLPFTPYSIQQVVKYHLPDIQKCYDQVVMEIGGKPPEGRVMAHFTILPNGLTSEPRIVGKKSTLKNDRVHDCITDEIRRWEFPQPNDGRPQPIDYPFDLKVAKDK